MKNWLSCFCLLCLPFVAKTQFQIQPLPENTSFREVIRTNFADSNMVIIGASLYASVPSIGLFQQAEEVLGIEAGWLISTGNSVDIMGPPSKELSTDIEELDYINTIQRLEDLHEGLDAQIVSIQFIPLGDTIQFEFVFASEHYEGLECLADYDRLEAKLYSVEGPDRSIRSEMIEVPGKPGVPVSSNTINGGMVDGETTYCNAQDPNWIENVSFYAGSHPELAFNGFTKVLSSNKMPVVIGQRYNLVISLSEGENALNDSGLFLGKGSLSSKRTEGSTYELIQTEYYFCDTLRVGDLVITEEGPYFTKITPSGAPIDTFVFFRAYQLRDQVVINYGLCPGDTVFIGDTFFVEPTTYQTDSTNADGCPVITHHHIKWNTNLVLPRFHEVCPGDTLFLADTFFVASTLYEEQISTNGICDTVYQHNINFNLERRRNEYIQACVGDTIYLFDTLFFQDAVYIQRIEEPDSCAVTVTYHIDFGELMFDLEALILTDYCSTDEIDLAYGRDFTAVGNAPPSVSVLDPFVNLPDGTGGSTTISQTVDRYAPETKLRDIGGLIEVCLTIEHSWLFDLKIILLAPSGVTAELQSQVFHIHEAYLGEPFDGDSNAPVPGLGYTYCWKMDATSEMTSTALATPEGSSLPAGDYRPSESFSKLDDSPANGEWKIIVTDLWEVDDGNVFDWSLRFASAPILDPERQGWLGLDPTIIADSLSLLTTLPVGSHDVTYFVIDEQGCYGDTTFMINVHDLPAAPSQVDTAICEPTMIYGHQIESGGNYQLSVGPPYFCYPSVINLVVEWPILDEVTGTALGNYDTWLFIVDNPIDASFYLDFGDGDTSHLATVQHTYNIPGPVSASIVIYDECDTLIKPFPGPFMIPNWYEISGRVETYPVETDPVGINNALIRSRWLAGPVEESITNASGTYQLLRQFEHFSPTIRPSKTEFPLNGLDIADLIQLSRHLNGSSSLAGPHQILGADIDCSDSLDQADVQLLRRFLLEPGLSFPDSCSNWIFWPQSYTFPDPNQPFDHPNSITIDSIQQNTSGVDFYGIKRGDLGNNASPLREALAIDTLFFLLENGAADMGDTIRATFRVQNFAQLVGFQFEFQFDTLALDFIEFEVGGVPGMTEDEFGLSKVNTGFIRVIWLDILGNAHNLPDLEEAFTLTFVARNQIIDRKNHMGINDRELKASAFDVNLEEAPVSLKMDQISSLNGKPKLAFSLLQNRPNPFTNQTIIPFELPKSARATLRIYNQLGQEVWRKTAQYPAGQSQEELRLTAAGLYYYSLETPWGNATKRMVLTKE